LAAVRSEKKKKKQKNKNKKTHTTNKPTAADKNTASILKYFAAGNRYGEDGRMLRLMCQLPSQEHGVIVEVLIDDIRQLPSDPAAVPSWAGAMNLDGDNPLINEALASTLDVGKLPLIPCRWMVVSKARMLEFLPLLSRDDGSSVPAEMLPLESNVLEHHALCHMLGLSARSLTDAYLDAFVAANPAQHLDPRVHLAGGRKADATALREPGFFPGFLAPWGRSGFPKGKVPCAVPTCFRSGDNVCAKCKEIAYCSRECQMANWKQHKRTCEMRSSDKGGGGRRCFGFLGFRVIFFFFHISFSCSSLHFARDHLTAIEPLTQPPPLANFCI
jgi:hypothetical protein